VDTPYVCSSITAWPGRARRCATRTNSRLRADLVERTRRLDALLAELDRTDQLDAVVAELERTGLSQPTPHPADPAGPGAESSAWTKLRGVWRRGTPVLAPGKTAIDTSDTRPRPDPPAADQLVGRCAVCGGRRRTSAAASFTRCLLEFGVTRFAVRTRTQGATGPAAVSGQRRRWPYRNVGRLVGWWARGPHRSRRGR